MGQHINNSDLIHWTTREVQHWFTQPFFFRKNHKEKSTLSRRIRLEALESRWVPAGVPLGPQFLVNETLALEGSPPDVAVVNTQGDFVAVWQSYQQTEDASGFGIYAQRFNADGTPYLGETAVLINTTTLGNQAAPAITTDGLGNFLVAWQGEDQAAGGYDIYARRGSFTTGWQTEEILVNQTTTGNQSQPAVAMDSTGRFVIAWQGFDAVNGYDVYARNGTFVDGLLTNEAVMNVNLVGDQIAPTVAMAAGTGDYLIAWQGPAPAVLGEEGSIEIYGNLYHADATAVFTEEFQVNDVATHDQVTPDAAMDATGDFVVVWVAEGQQGSGSDVFGRRFEFDGTTLTPETEAIINVQLVQPQRSPSVAMDAAGNALVTWQSIHQDGFSWGIFGQQFAANGDAIGTEFRVNTKVEGPQTSPAVSINADGLTVVIWLGRSNDHNPAVFAQRYLVPNVDPNFTVGTETQLSIFSEVEENPCAAAMAANGTYVVAWDSFEDGADGSGLGVFARRYDATGVAIGNVILVNSGFTLGNQSAPAVATDLVGNFVVVWESENQEGPTGGYGIYAQRYAPDGTPVGDVIHVNTTTENDQTNPTVAMDLLGNFVVVWQSAGQDAEGLGIYMQRYTADGTPLGGETLVNTFEARDQFSADVAMNASGQFVVVWVSDHPAADPNTALLDSEKSVFARYYSAAGVPNGAEFIVHNYVKDAQEAPAVAIDAAGNTVVVWQSINQDGNTWGVFARQFKADKTPLTPNEFQVNTTTEAPQRFADVGMSAAGEYMITWQSNHQDGSSWGIYSQEYTANGTPVGTETLVNTWTSGPQILPVIARNGKGDLAVFWSGSGTGHLEGVQGRLYGNNTPTQGLFVTGPGTGMEPRIRVFDAATGVEKFNFLAFGVNFLGGARVAIGDVNGDSIPDIIVAAGPGGYPAVNVFSGVDHSMLASFNAYGSTFRGGVYVATGNLDGDPAYEIIVGAGSGGVPVVRSFNLVGNLATQLPGPLGSFYAYGSAFRGGVQVGAGDVDGNPGDEIITGAGLGGLPRVNVYLADGTRAASFDAYDSTFRGGVYVAVGDVAGDHLAEIVTGPGHGMIPQVKVFENRGGSPAERIHFNAYSTDYLGGVRVGLADRNQNGKLDIVTSPGLDNEPLLSIFDGGTLSTLDQFFAYDPTFMGGFYVSGR